jgi:hypothetical protein
MSKPRTDITNWPQFDYCLSEEFEDAKGVIRIRILKKNRQHNDQKKKAQKEKQRSTKHTYKTKDRVTEPHKKPGVNSGAP